MNKLSIHFSVYSVLNPDLIKNLPASLELKPRWMP